MERATGLGRPTSRAVGDLVQARAPNAYRFRDDGQTPNNPVFPVVHYRSPVKLPEGLDPAAVFEVLFSSNGWRRSWRDGIIPFLHFHTRSHEVLGIARGRVRVQLGGRRGRRFDLKAGDVVVLPAGTGHKRMSASRDLLVVGAYPEGGDYDQPAPGEVDHETAVASIAAVKAPATDPVYGAAGPMIGVWRASASSAKRGAKGRPKA